MNLKRLNFPKSPNFSEAKGILSQIANATVCCSPRLVDRPIVLYGAGDLGKMAWEYFKRLDIRVEFVVDRYAEQSQTNSFWQDLQVVTPNSVELKIRKEVLLIICVVTSPYVEIAEQLYSEGWVDIVPFYDVVEAYRDRHPLSNGWFVTFLSANDIEQIESVLERWEDDVSRAHHLQFVAWHYLRQEWVFADAPINTKNRYFIPEIVATLTSDESFADVGAHIGNVSECFIEMMGGYFQKIWLIEPDKENLLILQQVMLAKLPSEIRKKIDVLPVAVGSRRESRKFFHGLNYASQCSDLGQETITVQTIDELGLTPSFIKIHIEGWELDALKGACETLHQSRPIVAVTSYHNQNGLWELPLWLMTGLPSYKFYMRLHSWCGTGAVVYAMP